MPPECRSRHGPPTGRPRTRAWSRRPDRQGQRAMSILADPAGRAHEGDERERGGESCGGHVTLPLLQSAKFVPDVLQVLQVPVVLVTRDLEQLVGLLC